jgi:hypothetical protein
MSYNTKNYTEQGGEKTVIGGTLEIPGALDLTGATITGVVTAAVVNNLTTTETGSALDAAQGKELKTLVDAKYTAANATEAVAGLVKQAANVPEAVGDTPTAAEFKALLDALIDAGIMAAPATGQEA